MKGIAVALAVAMASLLTACGGDPDGSQPAPAISPVPAEDAPTASGDSPHIAAVGDLVCAFGNTIPQVQIDNGHEPQCAPRSVSRLVTSGDYDAFLPLGDLQYSYGGYWRYVRYWDRYYGDVVDITHPVPGNHEGYADFTGYAKYFGAERSHMPERVASVHIGRPVGRITGYYSYDLGGWHIVALNSQLCMNQMWNVRTYWTNPIKGGGCEPGDPQIAWLEKDLADNADASCTLAYFHHPRVAMVTGGTEGQEGKLGNMTNQEDMVQALDEGGVDVILNGHEHNYQRWGPINADLESDPEGFMEFVVGTGGNSYRPLPEENTWPETVQAAQTGSYGLLDMQLNDAGYTYEFKTGMGEEPFEDSGSGTCH